MVSPGLRRLPGAWRSGGAVTPGSALWLLSRVGLGPGSCAAVASGLTSPTNPEGWEGDDAAGAPATDPPGSVGCALLLPGPRALGGRGRGWGAGICTHRLLPQRPAGPQRAGRAPTLRPPLVPVSQDLEDLEEAEEPDLEEDDDQKAVKDEL